jgi:hypothetical protein
VPFSKRRRFGSKRPSGLARLDMAPRELAPEVVLPPREPVRRWEIPLPQREREQDANRLR